MAAAGRSAWRTTGCARPRRLTGPSGSARRDRRQVEAGEEGVRDQAVAPQRLGDLLDARGGVQRVAEIDDRELGIAALAGDDRAGVQDDAHLGRDPEGAPIVPGARRKRGLDRLETSETAGVLHPLGERPRRDQLVADVAVHLAAVLEDRLVDVEEHRR